MLVFISDRFLAEHMILYVQLRSVTGQETSCVKKQNRNIESSEAEDSVCRRVFDRNENKRTSFFFFCNGDVYLDN